MAVVASALIAVPVGLLIGHTGSDATLLLMLLSKGQHVRRHCCVDPLVVDARAMGMTESQVLLRVEVPNALPLMLADYAARRCGCHHGRPRQSRGWVVT